MATQQAIIVQGPKKAALVNNAPIPKLRDDYILVKTVAVALNPTDWKHIDFIPCTGSLVGCDYSGIVEAVGKDVKKSFRKGDRVAGLVHGCNASQHQDGSCAEYIVAKGDLQIHIPDAMSFEDAATLGVGISTVGQSLYQTFQLPFPLETEDDPPSILIYGGSTATGSIAVQMAKMSGMHVIATCSEKNSDMVRELGADAVFDYNDLEAAVKIREHTDDALELAFDTVSIDSSSRFCGEALSSQGGCYHSLLYTTRCPRSDVDSSVTMAYTLPGEAYQKGNTKTPAKKEDFDFGVEWWQRVEGLLQEGRIIPHPVAKKPGGLKGVLDGLQMMRQGKVRAQKLVYRVDETG
ncbi:hypothetical protein AWENTII_012916 [Aspergillus wentii]|nr:hypothetical protein MW887_005821 [Aspergillus wentii]